MKKYLALIIAALLALAPTAALASWSQSNTITYATDSVKAGVQALDDEMEVVYGHLNNLDKAHAGTSSPVSPDTNDLWLDTNTSPPTLKYYTGAAWSAVAASGGSYSSGVTMDNGMKDESRNMFLRWASATSLSLYCSSAVPCTVDIAGSLYQNTSTTSLSVSGAGAGLYDVYVDQDSGSVFKLNYAANPYSIGAGERIVGSFRYTGSNFAFLSSHEVQEHKSREVPIGYFHAYATDAGQTFTNLAWTQVSFQNEVYDDRGWFDSASNYRYTPQEEGLYMLIANVGVTIGHSERIGVRIMKNGSTTSYECLNVGMSTDDDEAVNCTTVTYMNGATDYVDVDFFHGGSGANRDVNSDGTGMTSFKGWKIGGRY